MKTGPNVSDGISDYSNVSPRAQQFSSALMKKVQSKSNGIKEPLMKSKNIGYPLSLLCHNSQFHGYIENKSDTEATIYFHYIFTRMAGKCLR